MKEVIFILSVFYSPFALLGDGEESEIEEMSQSIKEFKEMALFHQVLHPDCKPVLEFGLVRV